MTRRSPTSSSSTTLAGGKPTHGPARAISPTGRAPIRAHLARDRPRSSRARPSSPKLARDHTTPSSTEVVPRLPISELLLGDEPREGCARTHGCVQRVGYPASFCYASCCLAHKFRALRTRLSSGARCQTPLRRAFRSLGGTVLISPAGEPRLFLPRGSQPRDLALEARIPVWSWESPASQSSRRVAAPVAFRPGLSSGSLGVRLTLQVAGAGRPEDILAGLDHGARTRFWRADAKICSGRRCLRHVRLLAEACC